MSTADERPHGLHAGPERAGADRAGGERVGGQPEAGLPERQSSTGFPVRQPTARLIAPGGRHRRPVPASLPEGSPALVLAVPNVGDDCLTGPAAEIASILGLDNPALDVRLAKVDNAGRADPAGIRAVLAEAAARRPAGAPSAVVVPLLATPRTSTIREIREAITASGTNARIAEVFNTNALLAEALHIRLADAGLARADRVRMFSITTSADGIVVATSGGPEAVGSASVTAVLLAARLALPVLPASLDCDPGIEEAAVRLQAMGVSRIAIAPCVIGPEADPGALEGAAATVGAKCAAPLGAHGNVVKLIAQAYGMALSQLETPGGSLVAVQRGKRLLAAGGRLAVRCVARRPAGLHAAQLHFASRPPRCLPSFAGWRRAPAGLQLRSRSPVPRMVVASTRIQPGGCHNHPARALGLKLASADWADRADQAGIVDAVDAHERAGIRGVHHHAVADVQAHVVDRRGV